MDTAELARLLENLIRLGTVAEVRHTARPKGVRCSASLLWMPRPKNPSTEIVERPTAAS